MTIDYYYHWLSPPCRYVSMVIKHLNLDVNYKVIDGSKGEHKDPAYLKVKNYWNLKFLYLILLFQVNPAGQIPAINDNGFYLSESMAIVQYLCNKYAPDSQLYPKDPQKRAQVERLIYFNFTNLMRAAKDIYVSKNIKINFIF